MNNGFAAQLMRNFPNLGLKPSDFGLPDQDTPKPIEVQDKVFILAVETPEGDVRMHREALLQLFAELERLHAASQQPNIPRCVNDIVSEYDKIAEELFTMTLLLPEEHRDEENTFRKRIENVRVHAAAHGL